MRRPTRVLPARTLAVARALEHWVVETPKAARAVPEGDRASAPLIAARSIERCPSAPTPRRWPRCLRRRARGTTSACCPMPAAPAVADPGAALVAAAHAAGIAVVPLVGPSSLLLALMASGHERPGVRVPRLPAGPRERARGARCAARGGLARARARADSSSRRRTATRRCWRRWRERCAPRHAASRRRRPDAADRDRSRRGALARWRGRRRRALRASAGDLRPAGAERARASGPRSPASP